MQAFAQWLTTLAGTALYKLIDGLVESTDINVWIKTYADKLVAKFLAKLESQDVEKELQDHVLDPIKKWLEKRLNVNL